MFTEVIRESETISSYYEWKSELFFLIGLKIMSSPIIPSSSLGRGIKFISGMYEYESDLVIFESFHDYLVHLQPKIHSDLVEIITSFFRQFDFSSLNTTAEHALKINTKKYLHNFSDDSGSLPAHLKISVIDSASIHTIYRSKTVDFQSQVLSEWSGERPAVSILTGANDMFKPHQILTTTPYKYGPLLKLIKTRTKRMDGIFLADGLGRMYSNLEEFKSEIKMFF